MIRGEACAADFYSALDVAISKLDSRLSRAADRRRVHRGRHAPVSVAEATASLAFTQPEGYGDTAIVTRTQPARIESSDGFDLIEEPDDQPWHIVREKEHPSEPMTVDDALFHMELLGHDFYLFNDKESGRPSVVYRRRAYDYGVMSLGI